MTSAAQPPVRKREIFGWAMFDFANSSYTTVIVTVAFSVYFTTLVAPGTRGDWLWGVGVMISNLIVLSTAPVVGALADGSGRKKHFLAGTWLLCVAGTAALWFAVPGAVILALALFVVSNVSFAMGEALVGGFLPEISTPRNVGRISGLGWGLGYFGGLACLLLIRPLLAGDFALDNLASLRLVWPVTAAFFFLAGIPTFVLLRERARRVEHRSLAHFAAEGFRRLRTTGRSLQRFRELVKFLSIFFVYCCGLMTVIAFAGIYSRKTLAFTANELIVLFLVLQLFSAAGALGGGPLQDRLGSRRTLQWILVLWILVCLGGAAAATKTAFWFVAMGAGLGIGSLQAASRGLVGLFSPPDKSGEFFGFWGLAMRAAFALGPFVFGSISALTGSQRIAVLITATFFVIGWVGLLYVDEEKGRRAAETWAEASTS
jgi:UMF1 family MFS transporter